MENDLEAVVFTGVQQFEETGIKTAATGDAGIGGHDTVVDACLVKQRNIVGPECVVVNERNNCCRLRRHTADKEDQDKIKMTQSKHSD